MQESHTPQLDTFYGPMKREAIPSAELHGEGHTFDPNQSLYEASEIGFSEAPTDGSTVSVLGETTINTFGSESDTIDEGLSFAIIKITNEGAVDHYALVGLEQDGTGRMKVTKKFLPLKEGEPVGFGRKGESPKVEDRNGVHSASELWNKESFLSNQGYSREHVWVSLVDGKVEVKDTSKAGVSIKSPDTWKETEPRIEALGTELAEEYGETARNDDSASVETEKDNTEQIANNKELVGRLLENPVFQDIQLCMEEVSSMLEDKRHKLLTLSHLLHDTAEEIGSFATYSIDYDPQHISSEMLDDFARKLDLIKDHLEGIEQTRKGGESLIHANVKTIEAIVEEIPRMLPELDERAEPDNHDLSNLASSGADTLRLNDEATNATIYAETVAGNNIHEIIGTVERLSRNLRSMDSMTEEDKATLRSNAYGLQNMLARIPNVYREAYHATEALEGTAMTTLQAIDNLKRIAYDG